MALKIDHQRFEYAHRIFQDHLLKMSNVPFTGFEHPFLVKSEISYKWRIYDQAIEILNLEKWNAWKRRHGQILQATRNACRPSITVNILEHRYGPLHSSAAALYKVRDEDIPDLEEKLFDFFLGGRATPEEFGQRFDVFAEYLRENKLGCNWAFMSYLAFLVSPQQYFPIRPSRFDALLAYYGIEQKISGFVSWDRYSVLLDLAHELKQKLALYGVPNAVEIQSYMWVVAHLLKQIDIDEIEVQTFPDFETELKARVKRAEERERIGLLGERFVYEQEVGKLREAGRDDLAELVKIVSFDDNYSFDIRSFEVDGREIHIEVKTTVRSPETDDGFWLSEIERSQAESDENWVLYRVWNIDTFPVHQNLGNIVLNTRPDWQLRASNWYVKHQS